MRWEIEQSLRSSSGGAFACNISILQKYQILLNLYFVYQLLPSVEIYQQNFVPQEMDNIDFFLTFVPTLYPHNVFKNLVKKVGEGTVEKNFLFQGIL